MSSLPNDVGEVAAERYQEEVPAADRRSDGQCDPHKCAPSCSSIYLTALRTVTIICLLLSYLGCELRFSLLV